MKGFIGFLAVCILVIWGLIALAIHIEEVSCVKRYSTFGKPTYDMLGGCIVALPNGDVVPADTIRVQP